MKKTVIAVNNWIAGAGKDEFAKYLIDNYGFKRFAFSDAIKNIKDDLFPSDTKDREVLVAIGEKLREIDPYVWINKVCKDIDSIDSKYIVVTDVRKKIERKALMDRFNVINVFIYCDQNVAYGRLKQRDGGNIDMVNLTTSPIEVALHKYANVDNTIINNDDIITFHDNIEKFLYKNNILKEQKQFE